MSGETVSIAAGDVVLEAVFQPGADGAAVVAPPHPEYGGRLDNPVVQAVAGTLAERGWATLCFNWRGVGRSEGRVSGAREAADLDYAAALAALRARAAGPILAAGYSFGAAAAVRAAAGDAEIARVLLVAPPLALLDAGALAGLGRPVGVVVGDADAFAPAERLAGMIEGVPGAVLRVLPGADHFFSTADRHDVARALLAVLSG